MATIIALEHEDGKRAVAVYKDGDMKVHHWLKDSDDEYSIFEIVSYVIKRLEGR